MSTVLRLMRGGWSCGIVACFSPRLSLDLWNALEVEEGGCKGASWPRALWSGGLQRDGDPAEQIGLWAGGGEGQTDARDGLDDAGAELEEPEPQGGELGVAEVMGFGHRIADGEHQPIGGGMEDETDLVGDRRAAAGEHGLS